MMTHSTIKALAKLHKIKMTDLSVLAPNNDPYMVGTAAHHDHGAWFARIWENYYSGKTNVHLRRIHYRLVSQEESTMTAHGKPYVYENTEACWKYLQSASQYARYLELVPIDAFDDRRNGKPIINHPSDYHWEPVAWEPDADDWDFPRLSAFELPDLPARPEYTIDGFNLEKPFQVEIWCEKSTMNDILEPVCERYQCNLVTGLGELSITECKWLVNRLAATKKPCRVLYLSDFDPAGQSMPVAVSRKLEWMIRQADDLPNTQVHHLLLTQAQCEHYQLPRIPIKETEKRAPKFEKRFGQGATELDALEALHEGEFKKLVVNAIDRWRDSSLYWRVQRNLDDARTKAFFMQDEVYERWEHQYGSLLARMDNIRQSMERDLGKYANELKEIESEYEPIWQAIREELARRLPELDDVVDVDHPEPEGIEELSDPLFNSDRSYLDQLNRYRHFKGLPSVDVPADEFNQDVAA